jgi:hypothetical protein
MNTNKVHINSSAGEHTSNYEVLRMMTITTTTIIILNITWGKSWHSGLGTLLPAGRLQVPFPVVSLEFFIDVFLPATLWPQGSTQPLTQMSTRNIFWGVKAAGAWG